MSKALGRPRKILDEKFISHKISQGYTVEWVAEYCGVHVDTIYTNYSDALRKGRALRDGCLQAKQFEAAMSDKPNPIMLIWLGKQFLGQADKQDIDVRKQSIVRMVVGGVDDEKLARLRNGPAISGELPEKTDQEIYKSFDNSSPIDEKPNEITLSPLES